MIRHFCDACGKEMDNGRQNGFSYLCHIGDLIDGKCGYVDINGDMVSGRSIMLDICHSCYNRVMSHAVKELRKIQNSCGVLT